MLRNTSCLSTQAKHPMSLFALLCFSVYLLLKTKQAYETKSCPQSHGTKGDYAYRTCGSNFYLCPNLLFSWILCSWLRTMTSAKRGKKGRKFRLGRGRNICKLLSKISINQPMGLRPTSLSSPAATVIMSPVSLLIVNMFGEGLLGACDKILYLSIPFCALGSSASMAVTVIT